MSDKLREAAQAVMDAKDILFLREMSVNDKVYLRLGDAINAIQAAFAEAIKESPTVAEQEAVGQLQECAYGRGQVLWFNKPADKSMLYAAPPRKEWVGLKSADFEKEKFLDYNFLSGAFFAESKLKEKNHD